MSYETLVLTLILHFVLALNNRVLGFGLDLKLNHEPRISRDPCYFCNSRTTDSCISDDIQNSALVQCICKNGFTGPFCRFDVLQQRCVPGYRLTKDDISNQHICQKECECKNGVPKSGKTCEIQAQLDNILPSHVFRCQSCNPGYTLTESGLCLSNICNCKYGQPLDSSLCPSRGREYCQTCKDNYYKLMENAKCRSCKYSGNFTKDPSFLDVSSNICYKNFQIEENNQNQYKNPYKKNLLNAQIYDRPENFIPDWRSGPVTEDERLEFYRFSLKLENKVQLKSWSYNFMLLFCPDKAEINFTGSINQTLIDKINSVYSYQNRPDRKKYFKFESDALQNLRCFSLEFELSDSKSIYRLSIRNNGHRKILAEKNISRYAEVFKLNKNYQFWLSFRAESDYIECYDESNKGIYFDGKIDVTEDNHKCRPWVDSISKKSLDQSRFASSHLFNSCLNFHQDDKYWDHANQTLIKQRPRTFDYNKPFCLSNKTNSFENCNISKCLISDAYLRDNILKFGSGNKIGSNSILEVSKWRVDTFTPEEFFPAIQIFGAPNWDFLSYDTSTINNFENTTQLSPNLKYEFPCKDHSYESLPCYPNKCYCENGAAATADTGCLKNGMSSCVSCNVGYELSSNFNPILNLPARICNRRNCCNNGESNKLCISEDPDQQFCDSCDNYYHLERPINAKDSDEMMCTRNLCRCPYGKVGNECEEDGGFHCLDCNNHPGHTLIGKICTPNRCRCPFGRAALFDESPFCRVSPKIYEMNNLESIQCLECNPGFVLENRICKSECDPLKGQTETDDGTACQCKEGFELVPNPPVCDPACTPAQATPCQAVCNLAKNQTINSNDQFSCSCLPGYTQENVANQILPEDKIICRPNICFCDNGIPASGAACYEDNQHICESCDLEFPSYHLENVTNMVNGLNQKVTRCFVNKCKCEYGASLISSKTWGMGDEHPYCPYPDYQHNSNRCLRCGNNGWHQSDTDWDICEVNQCTCPKDVTVYDPSSNTEIVLPYTGTDGSGKYPENTHQYGDRNTCPVHNGKGCHLCFHLNDKNQYDLDPEPSIFKKTKAYLEGWGFNFYQKTSGDYNHPKVPSEICKPVFSRPCQNGVGTSETNQFNCDISEDLCSDCVGDSKGIPIGSVAKNNNYDCDIGFVGIKVSKDSINCIEERTLSFTSCTCDGGEVDQNNCPKHQAESCRPGSCDEDRTERKNGELTECVPKPGPSATPLVCPSGFKSASQLDTDVRICVANTSCFCENGKAALSLEENNFIQNNQMFAFENQTQDICTTDQRHYCDRCNFGYELESKTREEQDTRKCIRSRCPCKNGVGMPKSFLDDPDMDEDVIQQLVESGAISDNLDFPFCPSFFPENQEKTLDFCKSCDVGYHLEEEIIETIDQKFTTVKTCRPNQCYCERGRTIQGKDCIDHGTEHCLECERGYGVYWYGEEQRNKTGSYSNDAWKPYYMSDHQTKITTCKELTCYCNNGTPARGSDRGPGACDYHREKNAAYGKMEKCSKCDDGYYLNDHPIFGDFKCYKKKVSCTCSNGTPATEYSYPRCDYLKYARKTPVVKELCTSCDDNYFMSSTNFTCKSLIIDSVQKQCPPGQEYHKESDDCKPACFCRNGYKPYGQEKIESGCTDSGGNGTEYCVACEFPFALTAENTCQTCLTKNDLTNNETYFNIKKEEPNFDFHFDFIQQGDDQICFQDAGCIQNSCDSVRGSYTDPVLDGGGIHYSMIYRRESTCSHSADQIKNKRYSPCHSCKPGYSRTGAHMGCRLNQCRCPGGVPVNSYDDPSKCPINGMIACQSCLGDNILTINPDFDENASISDYAAGIAKAEYSCVKQDHNCICNNGVPLTRDKCNYDGQEACWICHPGYHLDISTSSFSPTCKKSVCNCEHGTPADYCPINNMTSCKSCDDVPNVSLVSDPLYDLSKINLVPALWKEVTLEMLPNYMSGVNLIWKKLRINKPNGINLDIKKCVYTPPPTCVCPDGEVDETRCYYEGQTSCKLCRDPYQQLAIDPSAINQYINDNGLNGQSSSSTETTKNNLIDVLAKGPYICRPYSVQWEEDRHLDTGYIDGIRAACVDENYYASDPQAGGYEELPSCTNFLKNYYIKHFENYELASGTLLQSSISNHEGATGQNSGEDAHCETGMILIGPTTENLNDASDQGKKVFRYLVQLPEKYRGVDYAFKYASFDTAAEKRARPKKFGCYLNENWYLSEFGFYFATPNEDKNDEEVICTCLYKAIDNKVPVKVNEVNNWRNMKYEVELLNFRTNKDNSQADDKAETAAIQAYGDVVVAKIGGDISTNSADPAKYSTFIKTIIIKPLKLPASQNTGETFFQIGYKTYYRRNDPPQEQIHYCSNLHQDGSQRYVKIPGPRNQNAGNQNRLKIKIYDFSVKHENSIVIRQSDLYEGYMSIYFSIDDGITWHNVNEPVLQNPSGSTNDVKCKILINQHQYYDGVTHGNVDANARKMDVYLGQDLVNDWKAWEDIPEQDKMEVLENIDNVNNFQVIRFSAKEMTSEEAYVALYEDPRMHVDCFDDVYDENESICADDFPEGIIDEEEPEIEISIANSPDQLPNPNAQDCDYTEAGCRKRKKRSSEREQCLVKNPLENYLWITNNEGDIIRDADAGQNKALIIVNSNKNHHQDNRYQHQQLTLKVPDTGIYSYVSRYTITLDANKPDNNFFIAGWASKFKEECGCSTCASSSAPGYCSTFRLIEKFGFGISFQDGELFMPCFNDVMFTSKGSICKNVQGLFASNLGGNNMCDRINNDGPFSTIETQCPDNSLQKDRRYFENEQFEIFYRDRWNLAEGWPMEINHSGFITFYLIQDPNQNDLVLSLKWRACLEKEETNCINDDLENYVHSVVELGWSGFWPSVGLGSLPDRDTKAFIWNGNKNVGMRCAMAKFP